jgi:hypothetical protein
MAMTKQAGAPKPRAKMPRRKSVTITPAQRVEEGEGPLNKHWRTYFIQTLSMTSNVTAACKASGASASRAYKTRREQADFAAEWRAALAEGYEHLEMEVLACLRGTAPRKKMDVANAIRLLAAHRKTVAEYRAAQEPDDEREVLAAIDDMIDRMRREFSATATGDAGGGGDD